MVSAARVDCEVDESELAVDVTEDDDVNENDLPDLLAKENDPDGIGGDPGSGGGGDAVACTRRLRFSVAAECVLRRE